MLKSLSLFPSPLSMIWNTEIHPFIFVSLAFWYKGCLPVKDTCQLSIPFSLWIQHTGSTTLHHWPKAMHFLWSQTPWDTCLSPLQSADRWTEDRGLKTLCTKPHRPHWLVLSLPAYFGGHVLEGKHVLLLEIHRKNFFFWANTFYSLETIIYSNQMFKLFFL